MRAPPDRILCTTWQSVDVVESRELEGTLWKLGPPLARRETEKNVAGNNETETVHVLGLHAEDAVRPARGSLG